MVLDQRDNVTFKKSASDAAYTLAMHLLAYQLNQAAGACVPDAATKDAALKGQALLVKVGYDGNGTFLKPKSPDYQKALTYAKILDEYNNGLRCS